MSAPLSFIFLPARLIKHNNVPTPPRHTTPTTPP